MRQAPAVRLVTMQARSWRALEVALSALAAAVCAAWIASHAEFTAAVSAAVALTAATLAGALRWRCAGRMPVTIDWDGSAWTLDPGTPHALALSKLEVALDLDRLLVLRAVPTSPMQRKRWLTLALGSDPTNERALCVALYAARSGAAATAAGPGLPGV